MSVRFDSPNDTIVRTSDLPTSSRDWSACAFWMIKGTGGGFQTLFSMDSNAGHELIVQTEGTNVILYTAGSTVLGSDLQQDVWYFTALSTSPDGFVYAVHGPVGGTLTFTGPFTVGQVTTPFVPAEITISTSPYGEWLDGLITGFKLWDRYLDFNQLIRESTQLTPADTTGLNTFVPMLTAAEVLVDYSGNGRNFTTVGSHTTDVSPPVSWRTVGRRKIVVTAETASPIELVAASEGASSAAGDLTGQVNLSGFSSGLGVISAVLSAVLRLSASVSSDSVVSSTLTTGINLSAALSAGSDVAASLTTGGAKLVGSAVGVAGLSASLITSIPLSAETQGGSVVTGTVLSQVKFLGSVLSSSTLSGSIISLIRLDGASGGSSQVVGLLEGIVVDIDLSGESRGFCLVMGKLRPSPINIVTATYDGAPTPPAASAQAVDVVPGRIVGSARQE